MSDLSKLRAEVQKLLDEARRAVAEFADSSDYDDYPHERAWRGRSDAFRIVLERIDKVSRAEAVEERCAAIVAAAMDKVRQNHLDAPDVAAMCGRVAVLDLIDKHAREGQ